MGYWSKHPMGGDSPQDEACNIYQYMIEKENMEDFEDFFENINESTRRSIVDKYKYDLLYEIEKDVNYTFVVPYILLDYSIRFDKQEDLDKIKDLIGDGGACERGYDEGEFGPANYADALRRNVEYLFSSKYSKMSDVVNLIPSEDLSMLFDEGLLVALLKNIEQDNTGLVNKK